jgi:hypothetical protein
MPLRGSIMCFIALSVVLISVPDKSLSNSGIIIPYMLLWGLCRGQMESTYR